MTAPQVRKAGVYDGRSGGKISKFDLRFIKPNIECLPTTAIHTLEHLLATYIKEFLCGVIDISPMGCRSGFYLLIREDIDTNTVKDEFESYLKDACKNSFRIVSSILEAVSHKTSAR